MLTSMLLHWNGRVSLLLCFCLLFFGNWGMFVSVLKIKHIYVSDWEKWLSVILIFPFICLSLLVNSLAFSNLEKFFCYLSDKSSSYWLFRDSENFTCSSALHLRRHTEALTSAMSLNSNVVGLLVLWGN
jgi:hypothetical protein